MKDNKVGEHTQGEWIIKGGRYIANENNIIFIECLTSASPTEQTQALANARLIAAAPIMLDTLENIQDWMLEQKTPFNQEKFDLMTKAIKKAKGE